MAGYIGSKAVLLSTTAAVVTGDADIGGDLTVDTNTLFVDAANNRVGVGTNAPRSKLDVSSAVGTSPASFDAGEIFVVGNSSQAPADTREVSFGTAPGGGGYLRTIRDMSFVTVGSERMRIDSSGRVGINTTSPGARLQVDHPGNETFGTAIQVRTTGGTDDPVISLENFNGGSPVRYGIGLLDSGALQFLSGGYSGAFGTTRMVVTSTGSVGIGTSSPGVSLDVIGGIRARGGAPGAGGVNNNGYAFSAPGDNDSGMFSSADGQIEFYTNSAEAARINPHGDVRIGTTSYGTSGKSRLFVTGSSAGSWDERQLTVEISSNNGPAIGFHDSPATSAGIFKFWGPSSQFECRNFNDTGFAPILASAFTPSSDYRIKNDVQEVPSLLPKVMALRPVHYEKDGIDGREYGLIAHEVSEHLPNLVRGEKDAMRGDGTMELQTVNYMSLAAILVKAVQEQQAIIDALEARIVTLEGGAA